MSVGVQRKPCRKMPQHARYGFDVHAVLQSQRCEGVAQVMKTHLLKSISEAMKAYMLTHPFDSGNSDCQTVLDQLYHAYAESHEHDPQEIGDGFKELEEYLCVLPLDNNNAVFNLCCRLCSAYERKAFLDGLQYGAELMLELGKESDR